MASSVAHTPLAGKYPSRGAPIEVADDVDDDAFHDTDSVNSYLTSLSSSVRNYKYENGRRYHAYKEGHYLVPNDEKEARREDMKHHMITTLTDGKLHLAPMPPNPTNILDIGTGTGIWAIDMADEYPSAKVIGTDLSPIQPSMVPPNCSFEIDDAEAEWVYGSNCFDFIHLRFMTSGIKDWDKLLKQAMRALKPGGVIELVELSFHPTSSDGSLPETNDLTKLFRLTHQGLAKLGFSENVTQYKSLLDSHGFSKTKETVINLPLGPWPKDKNLKLAGLYSREQLLEGLEAITLAIYTRALGWTKEEVDSFLVGVRKVVLDKSVHCFWPAYFVYGRKPE